MLLRKKLNHNELAALWKNDPMMFIGTEEGADLIKYSLMGIPEVLVESQIRYFSKKYSDIFLSEPEAKIGIKSARIPNSTQEKSMFRYALHLPLMTATKEMKGLQIYPVLVLRKQNSMEHEMFYVTDKKEQLKYLGVIGYDPSI